MRERIEIKERTYLISTTGQRSLDVDNVVLSCWSEIYQKRSDLQDLTGSQNVLEGSWIFRIRNTQLENPISKSNFVFWRNKQYSIISISPQESYQRMIEIICNVIE